MEVAVAHSYTSCLYHCVFSTKERAKVITAELQERLWPYMGGIARTVNYKGNRIDIGGHRFWLSRAGRGTLLWPR